MEPQSQVGLIGANRAPSIGRGRFAAVLLRTLVAMAGGLLALAVALPAAQAQGVRVSEKGAVGIARTAEAGPRTAPAPAGQTGDPAADPFADPAAPLGRYAVLLDETLDQPLTFDEARARLAAGQFQRSTAEVPTLGNHAAPRWLHLDIDNPGATPLAYRLYLAEGWTDRLDVWLVGPDGETSQWHSGYERSPSRYLRMGLGFGFDAMLPPGRSELFVRADSVASAALALRLIPQVETGKLEGATQHWLGLVHGFLLALVATYALLWLALREANHLRYVAYVGSYLYMHLAYSGFGPSEVWPDSPQVAKYATVVGMTLFSSAGLWFARGFLGLAEMAPKVDRLVAWVARLALVAMAACVVADAFSAAVDLAFAYIMIFTFSMVGLGVLGVRRGREQAPVFLAASLVSMAGAIVTTQAVMGRLPFNAYTFRAVEVGVMVEAAIWALALGLRLRRQQEDRVRAMELAGHDPLTGLLNRRGFLEQAQQLYSTSMRNARPLAVAMLDIDHFKKVNDLHGHDGGDRTLVAVGNQLRSACRLGDIVARWGGEEFVMLLPETTGDQAHALAERFRVMFADMVVPLKDGGRVSFTASFGVAVRAESVSLEDVLRAADTALYAAKDAGRDRVVSGAGSAAPAAASEPPLVINEG